MLAMLRRIKLTNCFRTQNVCQSSSTAWIPPDGYDTGIMVYNSASKTKVPLKTLKKQTLSWYVCGPTVYDSAHIGHAICYVRFDIIRRILLSIFNIDVVQVMGITDIDDKIIHKAIDLNIDFRELTQYYEAEFFEDMDSIRVLRPSVAPRVTDNINNIITYVQKIIDNGYAYSVKDGSVYFDVQKYNRGGKLRVVTPFQISKLHPDSLKKSSQDFALWKGIKTDEPAWPAPWGTWGRPGWHIECSSMASRIFGNSLDLHSGGIDLLFPHHESEESQCCAHDETLQWCNYWIHSGHLYFKDRKMSKSLRNIIGVRALLKTHSSNTFRLFCLEKPYRSDIEYDPESSLIRANNRLECIKCFFHSGEAYLSGHINSAPLNDVVLLHKLSETRIAVKEALSDNFDYTRALNIVMSLIDLCIVEINKKSEVNTKAARSNEVIESVSSYVRNILSVFGLYFPQKQDIAAEPAKFVDLLTGTIPLLVNFRNTVEEFIKHLDVQGNGREILSDVSVADEDSYTLVRACKEFDSALLLTGLNIKDLNSTELLESGARLSQIMNLLLQFRGTVRLFALLQTSPSLYSNLNKSQKMQIRKERQGLLLACDKLRTELISLGFLIMDHTHQSSWSIFKEH